MDPESGNPFGDALRHEERSQRFQEDLADKLRSQVDYAAFSPEVAAGYRAFFERHGASPQCPRCGRRYLAGTPEWLALQECASCGVLICPDCSPADDDEDDEVLCQSCAEEQRRGAVDPRWGTDEEEEEDEDEEEPEPEEEV